MTTSADHLQDSGAVLRRSGVLGACFILLMLVNVAAAQEENVGPDNLENIAAGRPYTLEPSPSYALCTDDDDTVQLTDGRYAAEDGTLWSQTPAVGWQHVPGGQVSIVIDLGAVMPIRGVSFSTAAGSSSVGWPAGIFLLVSDDGQRYSPLGDLVSLSARHNVPPEIGYATHRYWTDQLETYGRYVQLLVRPGGIYAFADEIEIYRGEAGWVGEPRRVSPVRDPAAVFADAEVRTQAGIQKRLFTDLRRCREQLKEASISGTMRSQLARELDAVEQQIAGLARVDDAERFRAIYPLNDLHARIYAVYGAMARAEGVAPFSAWAANRWDRLTPLQRPPSDAGRRIEVAMMQGETRSAAFNLSNATAKPITARVTLQGLPRGISADVFRVEWTDTTESIPVAAALTAVTPEQGTYPITVPAGMTRQVWLDLTPHDATADRHRGRVVIERDGGPAQTLSLELRVFDLAFPPEPTLHMGGWDYTDRDEMLGLTPTNVTPLIDQLKQRFVDTPWATSRAVPYGRHDDQGQMVERPDTAHFDRWIDRWPEARRYAIFAMVGDSLGSLSRDEPAFDRAVGEWITFWVNHAQGRGIEPEQLLLLLVDEPSQNEQAQRTVDWARPIKAAQPAVVIWTDPVYHDTDDALPALWEVVDVVCPHRPHLLTYGEAMIDFYQQQRSAGRRLELYSCLGPVLHLDPYSYHRLQAWACFQLGAEASNFWAFGDTGKGGTWNPYVNDGISYTPLFLGPDSATPAKHLEAMREGVQDHEYLVMLRDRVRVLEENQPQHRVLEEARQLLETACDRVLQDSDAEGLNWMHEKDRGVADRVRVEIAEMLSRLQAQP